MSHNKQALLVIDLQNDYFSSGLFPLWNSERTLNTIESLIFNAQAKAIPVILVQHIADPHQGIAPFFNADSVGAEIHTRIRAASPDGIVVVKHFADSFYQTKLSSVLAALEVTELLLCGMMTQNCVTHTALSKEAEKYVVKIIPDACTSVSELVHLIALHAVSPRTQFVSAAEACR